MGLTIIILLSAVYTCLAGPVYPQQQQPKAQNLYITDDMKMAMVKDLQNEVLKVAVLKTLADSIKLEQVAEDKILEAAVETLQEDPSPERTEKLKEVEQLLKRDKRAVQILNGLLGGSSGGGGGGAEASAGSDSGSILNLIGPLLGSSSGGAGGGGDDGGGSGGSSDLGSIINLIGPLSGSSSGGGGDDGGAGGGSSDLSSILSISGPLLGSSSGGGGGDGAGVSASAGSDSGSILNLITPLLGSSSGGSSGGGDASGGSGLGNILALSSSSKGGGASAGGGVTVEAGAQGENSLLGNVKGAKFALVSDKIQLLMRVKFGLLSKILTTITNKIAQVSIPPHEQNIDNLKYPS